MAYLVKLQKHIHVNYVFVIKLSTTAHLIIIYYIT